MDVSNDDAFNELPESYFPSFEMEDYVDQGVVQDLASAIRRGDRTEAEQLLDRLFRGDTTLNEWIQRGRYGPKARAITPERAKAA